MTGVDRTKAQIKSHVDGLKIKMKAYDELISMTNVGVDPQSKLPICSYEQ